MPRGQPDFGMYAVKDVTASISDMGEVAARLGSIVTYDKRGDVVDFDNFEEPNLRWIVDAALPCYGRLHHTRVKSGSQDIVLYAVGDVGDANISSRITILASTKLGFEISFDSLSANLNLWFYNEYFSGSTHYRAGLKIDPVLKKIYLRDIDDEWKEFQDLPLLTSPCYYTMKYVVDFSTGYYMRVMFGKFEYDASAEPCYSAPSVEAAQVTRVMKVETRNAGGGLVYLDDFVQTQAEP